MGKNKQFWAPKIIGAKKLSNCFWPLGLAQSFHAIFAYANFAEYGLTQVCALGRFYENICGLYADYVYATFFFNDYMRSLKLLYIRVHSIAAQEWRIGEKWALLFTIFRM